MMELKNRDEVKFCYLDGEELVESLDKELNTLLLQMCLDNKMNLPYVLHI